MSMTEAQKIKPRRWVVKIGSALLTNDGRGLDCEAIDDWVSQIVSLMDDGVEVILVSSGSIAEGIARLGWDGRPDGLHQLQAAAAVGQMGLVRTYESSFQRFSRHTAQILLDHDDFASRQRYLNARSTLMTLVDLGVVPVVNENDTVVTDEIRFGDNDSLGALVANLVDADVLVILTDKDGLYTANPDVDPQATLITRAEADDPSLDRVAGGSNSGLGRGGMQTKLQAARLAASSGCDTIIAGGRQPDVLSRIAAGESVGTTLTSKTKPLAARKQWLAGHLQVKGTLHLDDGAAKVLRAKGRSLLPVGVTAVNGNFTRGDLVLCVDPDGVEVARGLVNYNAGEAGKISGASTSAIADILGYREHDELIHRDNMVITGRFEADR